MGYETKLVFVTNLHRKNGKPVGYNKVEAELEMGCICNSKVGELIDKLQKEVKPLEDKYRDLTYSLKEGEKEMFDDGDYRGKYVSMEKEKRDKIYKRKIGNIRTKLDKFVSYVYDGNEECYTDSYGNLLLVATLKEVKEAIIKDNAKEIASGNYEFGYRRFNIALKLIEGFEGFGEEVSVVMFGH